MGRPGHGSSEGGSCVATCLVGTIGVETWTELISCIGLMQAGIMNFAGVFKPKLFLGDHSEFLLRLVMQELVGKHSGLATFLGVSELLVMVLRTGLVTALLLLQEGVPCCLCAPLWVRNM